ncbi:MAG: hypothetical protein M1272_06015 [Firmicutes bacterium]|nr:hypothetical protein [Bacillota bacterium]
MKFVAAYFIFGVVIAALAVVVTRWQRQNRLKRQGGPPAGFTLTNETFVDPTTGRTQRVWFNPQTGERYYETFD